MQSQKLEEIALLLNRTFIAHTAVLSCPKLKRLKNENTFLRFLRFYSFNRTNIFTCSAYYRVAVMNDILSIFCLIILSFLLGLFFASYDTSDRLKNGKYFYSEGKIYIAKEVEVKELSK